MSASKTKDNLRKFAAIIEKFVESDLFIYFNALFVFIGWVSEAWVPVLSVLCALNILPLFFFKDTKHLLSLLAMFPFMISTSRHELKEYAPLLAIIIVLLVGMLVNLIRFKHDKTCLHPTKIKGFHCALLALAVPFAFGGVGSPYEHPLAVLAALALVLVFGVGYTYFFVTNNDSENKKKLPEYMIKVLFAAGIVIVLQIIVYFSRLDGLESFLAAVNGKSIALGWAGPNNVAPTLSLCIPAAFYLCIKHNKLSPIFAVIALFEYALLFTTGCRGAILFTTIALLPMIFYVICKSEKRALFCITVSAVFLVAIVLIGYYGEYFGNVLGTLLGKGLSSSGRTDGVYPEAIETFKRWPFFGAGWDYRIGDLIGGANDGYSPYWYHSTVLQILANMGIVGLITFVFFYFWRYRSFLELRKNPAVMALAAGTALFDAYGMVDTNFFGPTFFILLLLISLVVDLNLPENRCRAFGGRNPFADIATGCKVLVSKIKNASKKKPIMKSESSAADGSDMQSGNSDISANSDLNNGTEENSEADNENGTENQPTDADFLPTERVLKTESVLKTEKVLETESVLKSESEKQDEN